jgi:multiple sugar transport system permease protein
MVLTSLKSSHEAVTWPPDLLPSVWRWSNYAEVWRAGSFGRWLFNSLAVATAVAIGNVALGGPAAFAFARLRFPGRNLLFFSVLATLMIPGELTLIPVFFILSRLGWINTYLALIVPFLVNGYSVFLLRQFFEGIPESITDAATLDGAGPVRLFWSVALPMARPAVAVSMFLSFVGTWNSYLYPLVVTRSVQMRTITVGLSLFQQEYGSNWVLLMGAATIIAAVPVVAFLIVERHLTDALTVTDQRG